MASALYGNERPKRPLRVAPSFMFLGLDVSFVAMQRNAMTRGETYAT
jgi:hypothetical protein